MKKKIKNSKGFTLIELLAVIVILAILMTLAVIGMQQIMNNARKDTYVTTALQYINYVRLGIVNVEYPTPDTGNCIIVKTDGIELDSGSKKSPFGPGIIANQSYILVKNEAASGDPVLKYYITMVDEGNSGFLLTEENLLNDQKRKLVKRRGELDLKAKITVPATATKSYFANTSATATGNITCATVEYVG